VTLGLARIRALAVIGVVAVGMLAAGAVLAGCGSSTSSVGPSTERVATGSDSVPASPLRATAGPAHYKAVDFGLLRLWVPRRYTVFADGGGCASAAGTLYLPGNQAATAQCPAVGGGIVTVGTLGGSVPHGPTRTIHGYRVVEIRSHFYAVPALDVTIELQGHVPSAVLTSIGPSPEAIVLAAGPAQPVPGGWRLVSYRGVEVDVPSTWPTVASSHVAFCTGPFGSAPTAFVGPQPTDVPSCPAVLPEDDPHYNGVWLTPGADLGSPSRSITTPSGQHLRLATATWDQVTPLLFLSYRGETIELGLGPDPDIARAVLDSIRYHAGATDTPVGGSCPTWIRTAMPTPRRVTAKETLGGLERLLPAGAGAQPRVSAASVWASVAGDHARPGLTYQLLLARVIPPERHPSPVLAWIVYGVGTTTRYGNCGGRTATAVDAETGKTIEAAGALG
jgi:hypothetical protein